MSHETDVQSIVLSLERAALDRWGKGDPSGYLQISDDTVSYFDPFHSQRIDGLDALSEYYKPIQGRIRIERDEIIDPRVQLLGDVAILTFNYQSHGSEGVMNWHCTEVYQQSATSWRIVHTHWSVLAKPQP
jgi:hypothetical protein